VKRGIDLSENFLENTYFKRRC